MDSIAKMSSQSKEVLRLAEEESKGLFHVYVGTEHILLALVQQEEIKELLLEMGIDSARIPEELVKIVQKGPDDLTYLPSKLPMTPRGKKIIEYAKVAAEELGSPNICPEHLFLGVCREMEGVGGQILQSLAGLNGFSLIETVRTKLQELPLKLLKKTTAGLRKQLEEVSEELSQYTIKIMDVVFSDDCLRLREQDEKKATRLMCDIAEAAHHVSKAEFALRSWKG